MLWMLGVVAILVDVVSRFSGEEKAVTHHHGPAKVVVYTTTPTPPTHVTVDMTPRMADVTFVVLKGDKENASSLDNNDLSPDEEGDSGQNHLNDERSLAGPLPNTTGKNGDLKDDHTQQKMKPSNTTGDVAKVDEKKSRSNKLG